MESFGKAVELKKYYVVSVSGAILAWLTAVLVVSNNRKSEISEPGLLGRNLSLALLGLFGGVAFLLMCYGYTTSFRRWYQLQKGAMIRVQMWAGFFAFAAYAGMKHNSKEDWPYEPINGQVAFGAFLFGIGMQVSDGCATGTLANLADLRGPRVIAFVGFLLGNIWGAHDVGIWESWFLYPVTDPPTPRAFSWNTLQHFGATWAVPVQTVCLLGAAALVSIPEYRRYGKLLQLEGPLPEWAVGAVLALILTLNVIISSDENHAQSWGVSSPLGVWACQPFALMSPDILKSMNTWSFFGSGAKQAELADASSTFWAPFAIENVGFMFGIALASLLTKGSAGTAPKPHFALVAGVMLGYGARIAYGCNVGAYQVGLATGNLHGFFWIVCSFPGQIIGMYIRPYAGCDPEPELAEESLLHAAKPDAGTFSQQPTLPLSQQPIVV